MVNISSTNSTQGAASAVTVPPTSLTLEQIANLPPTPLEKSRRITKHVLNENGLSRRDKISLLREMALDLGFTLKPINAIAVVTPKDVTAQRKRSTLPKGVKKSPAVKAMQAKIAEKTQQIIEASKEFPNGRLPEGHFLLVERATLFLELKNLKSNGTTTTPTTSSDAGVEGEAARDSDDAAHQ
jgi:hypothetical protein